MAPTHGIGISIGGSGIDQMTWSFMKRVKSIRAAERAAGVIWRGDDAAIKDNGEVIRRGDG